MPTLLYYPLVRPPREVLHQALLYWDDIASVVPEDTTVYDNAVSNELEELRVRGLYHPIVVGSELTTPLNDGIQSDILVAELRQLAAGPRRPQFSVLDGFLFRTKVGYFLEREIVDLGLGRRIGASTLRYRQGRSLAVSREVQLLVIGALAQEVASTTTTRAYTPYTDHQSAHDTSVRTMRPGMGVGAWRVELGRLLPTPAPGTLTSEVLAFRERYTAERERLMGATQTLLSDLSRDWEHPADVLLRLQMELTQAREDYQSAARSNRMAWVSRSISVTVGVAAAAAGALVFPELGWVAGIAGSIGFNIATREVRPMYRAWNGHPFSYLHHVDRELTQ
ncbi:hypothetical protein [Streptomyces albipurpureus]|uniref:Uncharacterized protein n=1 Tax=Streptomyces albipurpureus TaxID=2897419 RepID=A0ABT0UTP1_9ACTN|nr:hypothetical protein [Streptomyces sp. CWNU-1]MCM2390970.1 hypothetical protein [Streptomyces sp. CWNU-1]